MCCKIAGTDSGLRVSHTELINDLLVYDTIMFIY